MRYTILHILCEGQTEERFVKEVLSPLYILTEKWAGLSFKNGPPERAYKVNKIMRRCHCSDLVFNHLLSLFEPV